MWVWAETGVRILTCLGVVLLEGICGVVIVVLGVVEMFSGISPDVGVCRARAEVTGSIGDRAERSCPLLSIDLGAGGAKYDFRL